MTGYVNGRELLEETPARSAATAGPAFPVVIADDQDLYRAGLESALKRKLGCTVLHARTSNELISALDQNPSVTLMVVDLSLPGLHGPAALGALRARFPAIKLVALASTMTRETVLVTLSAGIHGFIPKRSEPAQMVEAIRHVLGGNIFVPSSLASLPLTSEAGTGEDLGSGTDLTRRERQIMTLMGTGMSYKDIGLRLEIAPGTVKAHVCKAFRTLGVHSKLGAIRALGTLESAAAETPVSPGLLAA